MTESVRVRIRRLPHSDGLQLPAYESEGAAGMDLRAAVHGTVVIRPGERKLIPTGLSIAVPKGYEAQVRPRSGLALKQGVTMLNSPGTIDSDYRGEVGLITINHGEKPFEINRCRLRLQPVSRCRQTAIPAPNRGGLSKSAALP